MEAVTVHAPERGVRAVCRALVVPRATYYRTLRPWHGPRRRGSSLRALTTVERRVVLEALLEPRFCEQAPAEVYATLLDEGRYLCAARTMYRILDENKEIRDRRDQLRHPSYARPELLATTPNQLWSWDITKLKGPEKWNHYHLYVVLDVYSRYVVGWMVADRESATLATKLIAEICKREHIEPGQLALRADRGSSMRSKCLALMFADLGVTKTHSRPHVSDDNSYSESQFKTLKYRPDFPARFGSLEDPRAFCNDFFDWYNLEHHHVALALLTPQDVHHGAAPERLARRAAVLALAFAQHPQRFVARAPHPGTLPAAAWINKPRETTSSALSAL